MTHYEVTVNHRYNKVELCIIDDPDGNDTLLELSIADTFSLAHELTRAGCTLGEKVAVAFKSVEPDPNQYPIPDVKSTRFVPGGTTVDHSTPSNPLVGEMPQVSLFEQTQSAALVSEEPWHEGEASPVEVTRHSPTAEANDGSVILFGCDYDSLMPVRTRLSEQEALSLAGQLVGAAAKARILSTNPHIGEFPSR